MDRHQQMTVFDAVATEQGLAAASRRLGVSEATVSRALAALERRLGTRLLMRSTRGVTLTEVGRVFAVDCSRLLRAVEEAEASANGLHVEPRGLLKLVTPLLFGDRLLMPVVLDYMDARPGIEMSVTYQDSFPNLHEEGIDVAVLIGALPDGYMVARKVGTVRQMICASPAYLERRAAPRTPVDLAGHSLVFCTASNRMLEWRFQREGSLRNVALKPTLRCTTQLAAINAAINGAGLASCLSHEVHEHLEAGRLCPVLDGFEPDSLPVHLVYREGRRASARVRSFIDFAVERLRQHPVLRH
ncbi:LysR family transcriptional regulator [Pseudomonas sp. LS-2]|jgi:DNA-binding transcriptional LysR family regulator|uniref:LysR family transcriptional regulator n=1 Tax=Pseudomonas sp. LS-2 TaxID=2315859 RepID=UPI000E725863|nr:LysR family transcriptional regulator [Pseudomonas sp. LS-2]RJX83342.1 LysR family transcriptional regulator [Pseudomonas sp. LS-2]